MTQSIILLLIYNNKRRKTPLITCPFTEEAYAFYKASHPDWILKAVELDTKRS